VGMSVIVRVCVGVFGGCVCLCMGVGVCGYVGMYVCAWVCICMCVGVFAYVPCVCVWLCVRLCIYGCACVDLCALHEQIICM
jgi:hypothetical protein